MTAGLAASASPVGSILISYMNSLIGFKLVSRNLHYFVFNILIRFAKLALTV